jgi:hypothetical protein
MTDWVVSACILDRIFGKGEPIPTVTDAGWYGKADIRRFGELAVSIDV